METQNNNKWLFLIVGVIIGVLLILGVLFTSGIISFKSDDDTTDENITSSLSIVDEEVETSVDENTRYYQYYLVYDPESEHPSYMSREIELNDDGTARWRFGGNGTGGNHYKGTYVEDDSTITLTLERDMRGLNGAVCDKDNIVFPCETTLTLNKNSDGTLSSVNELNNNLSYEYKLVDKTSLHHFN